MCVLCFFFPLFWRCDGIRWGGECEVQQPEPAQRFELSSPFRVVTSLPCAHQFSPNQRSSSFFLCTRAHPQSMHTRRWVNPGHPILPHVSLSQSHFRNKQRCTSTTISKCRNLWCVCPDASHPWKQMAEDLHSPRRRHSPELDFTSYAQPNIQYRNGQRAANKKGQREPEKNGEWILRAWYKKDASIHHRWGSRRLEYSLWSGLWSVFFRMWWMDHEPSCHTNMSVRICCLSYVTSRGIFVVTVATEKRTIILLFNSQANLFAIEDQPGAGAKKIDHVERRLSTWSRPNISNSFTSSPPFSPFSCKLYFSDDPLL